MNGLINHRSYPVSFYSVFLASIFEKQNLLLEATHSFGKLMLSACSVHQLEITYYTHAVIISHTRFCFFIEFIPALVEHRPTGSSIWISIQ